MLQSLSSLECYAPTWGSAAPGSSLDLELVFHEQERNLFPNLLTVLEGGSLSQEVTRFCFFWSLSPWRADGHPFAVSQYGLLSVCVCPQCPSVCPKFLFLQRLGPMQQPHFYFTTTLETLFPKIVLFWVAGEWDFSTWICAHKSSKCTF